MNGDMVRQLSQITKVVWLAGVGLVIWTFLYCASQRRLPLFDEAALFTILWNLSPFAVLAAALFAVKTRTAVVAIAVGVMPTTALWVYLLLGAYTSSEMCAHIGWAYALGTGILFMFCAACVTASLVFHDRCNADKGKV